jgi:hypothetical protein
VNNTSVYKYWKILFYSPNTDTGTFEENSTDIDTDAQYTKLNTDILVFSVFSSISILCFKKLSKVLQNKVSLFVKGLNNILFNNVNNLAFLVINLTINMKKVDSSYALPDVISFQKNEILRFLAFDFLKKY